MLVKAMYILNQATGIIAVASAVVFALWSNELAKMVSGTSMILIGGMYIATSILTIVNKCSTKE